MRKSLLADPPKVSPFVQILCFAIFISSCAPRSPIFIDEVWSSEPPRVGKIVTMGLKIKTNNNEDTVILSLNFPETIAVISEHKKYELSMAAKEETDVYVDICVLKTGSWPIRASLVSLYEDGELKYGDTETIGVLSYPEDSMLLMEREIRYSQAAETQRSSTPVEEIGPSECTR
jgi:hypothetical protein